MKFEKLFSLMYKKVVAGLLMCFAVISLGKFLHMNKLLVLSCQIVMGIMIYLVVLIIEKDKWVNVMIDEVIRKLRKR